MKKEKF